MELTILDYLGLPEGSILSVRSGPTRRQSPLPCTAPFRLPPGPWPLRIDVLGLLGKSSSHVTLASGDNGLCRLPLEGKDGRPMSVTFQVCPEGGQRPKTSQALTGRADAGDLAVAPVKKRDAEADARAYLDKHRLHEFMHGLFELLLRERPEDPYTFMATRFRQAAAMEEQSAKEGSPGSPVLGLKASRSSVSTAPTSAASLSLSSMSPNRDSTAASFGDVPEGHFKVLVRSMRGRSVAKLVVSPGEKVAAIKQRLKGAASAPVSSMQLLWLAETLPNDSTLEDWFVEPGLAVLNLISSHKEPRLQHVLSGASEGGMRLWSCADAENVGALTSPVCSAILAMATNWERMRVVCTTSDGRMQLWDVREGTCLNSIVAHQDEAGCVDVDWSAEQALTGCIAGAAKLWCLKTFRCLKVLPVESAVDSLSVDWGKKRACGGLRKGTVRLWDLESAQVLGDFEQGADAAKEHGTAVSGMAIDCTGQRALSGFEDGRLAYWRFGETVTGTAEASAASGTSAAKVFLGHYSALRSIAAQWRDAGSRALVGSDDGSLSLWRLDTAECLARFARHIGFVWAVHADWASERAVSGAFDGCLKLWDLRTGECLRTIQAHSRPIRSICCG